MQAHARDELGISTTHRARPLQAAFSSAAAFVFGGLLPLLVALLAPLHGMVTHQYTFALVSLALLGALAARAGGAHVGRAVVRVCLLGTLAMAITAMIGHWFGVALA